MLIVVVGAGIAGLTVARSLYRAGIDVTVLERSAGVGGRVRTDMLQGFLLDRGFQVLFTEYPAARRELDFAALQVRRFDPGAIIAFAGERHILSDPTRDPVAALPALRSSIVTLEDKIRTALLFSQLAQQSIETIREREDESTERFLLRHGFSGAYIERFIRPFFGGIFLDRSLQTTAKAFQFYGKMLATGDTIVPADGMGAISDQLAQELIAADRVRLNAPVAELVRTPEGTVVGVRLAGGETIAADAVVMATPAPEVARLTGLPMPSPCVGVTCLYFAGPASVYDDKKIVLHANPGAFVNNVVQIDNVAPECAPPGQHLLSVTVLGVPEGDDSTLYATAGRDLRRMWAGDRRALDAIKYLRPLTLYRIPFAQFAQPVGIFNTLPDNITSVPGLFLTGEFSESSSINGAMLSGEACARLLERI